MLTTQQLSVILSSGNSVSFDGENYMVSDVDKNITAIVATDVQATINALSASIAALQTQLTALQANIDTTNLIMNAIASFQLSNTSPQPKSESVTVEQSMTP